MQTGGVGSVGSDERVHRGRKREMKELVVSIFEFEVGWGFDLKVEGVAAVVRQDGTAADLVAAWHKSGWGWVVEERRVQCRHQFGVWWCCETVIVDCRFAGAGGDGFLLSSRREKETSR